MQDRPGLDNNPHITQEQLSTLHDDLYGWCLSRCHYEPAPAEDLLQEVYIEILSGKAVFKQQSSLKTFLFSVAQNIAHSQFRKLKIGLKLITQYGNNQGLDGILQSSTEVSTDNSKVWQAVRSLPAKQRDMTELVFYRELTIQEAANIMGISVGSGRVHYQRAKQNLAKILGSDKHER